MKSSTNTITDPEFGLITLRERTTARHLIFRARNDSLSVTVPPHTRREAVLKIIDEKRDVLRKLMRRKGQSPLSPGDIIPTRTFTIEISNGTYTNVCSRQLPGKVLIMVPPGIDWRTPLMQKAIAREIHRHLKKAAENFLPQRLEQWARQTGNRYNGVIIGRGVRRLGACRSDRRITLSYHLMYLPDRLIDYVILHELAHLSEMSHNARFHEICNRYCNGNELILRKELRQFPFPTGQ